MFNLFGNNRKYPGETTYTGDATKFDGDKTPFVHAQSFMQSCITGGYHLFYSGGKGRPAARIHSSSDVTPQTIGGKVVSIRDPRTGEPLAFMGLVGDGAGHAMKLAIYNDTPLSREGRGAIDLQDRLKHTGAAMKLNPQAPAQRRGVTQSDGRVLPTDVMRPQDKKNKLTTFRMAGLAECVAGEVLEQSPAPTVPPRMALAALAPKPAPQSPARSSAWKPFG